jgi:AcrR family transcriptional regulator
MPRTSIQDKDRGRDGTSAKDETAQPATPTSVGVVAPFVNPVEHLTGTARSILEAARKLLRREGFGALSVGAVAKMAGEHKSTVMYHFGDKAGLIAALTDSMLFDMNPEPIPALSTVATLEDRVRLLLDFHLRVARDSEYWRTLFDLTPHLVRDRRLHARFAALMHSYYREVLRILDLEGLPDNEADIVASLILSVLEGFALQRELMGPRGFDLEKRFELWQSMLVPFVERWTSPSTKARLSHLETQ